MTLWHILQHWLAVHTGTVNESGPWYGFWSGFGSDLGEVTILGAVIATWKHHACAVPKCLRIGKHPVEGAGSKTCHKHSTLAHHKRLQDKHARDFPAQHALLNAKEQPCPTKTPAPKKAPQKRQPPSPPRKLVAKPVKKVAKR